MFSGSKKNNSTTPNNGRIETLIGEGTAITGNINAHGIVKVDGEYIGDINTQTEVVVGSSGIVKGNIYSGSMTVQGKVEGNVTCSEVLEILETGIVEGDICVSKFSMSEGGILNGRCSMGKGEYDKLVENNENNQEENIEVI